MLSRANRLSKNRDVRRVLQKGRRVSSASVRLVYMPSRYPGPRFAAVVSAKTAKLATARNRLKRVVRAVLYQFVQTQPTFRVDGVITITQNLVSDRIVSDCEHVLEQMKV